VTPGRTGRDYPIRAGSNLARAENVVSVSGPADTGGSGLPADRAWTSGQCAGGGRDGY